MTISTQKINSTATDSPARRLGDAKQGGQMFACSWRSVRDPQALERLTDTERAAWQALWRDLDKMDKRVTDKSE